MPRRGGVQEGQHVVTRRKRGVALAGGGPLGAIWEIGALVALDEALVGLSLADADIYVGVSSGSFIAAGLANGMAPRAMHRMFIESETADDPFEPDLLLRPALKEYLQRLASLPRLLGTVARRYVEAAGSGGFFQELASALPTGVFDNAGIGDYLAELFSAAGRTNDFRRLRHKLFLVATDLDTAEAVPFGARGWDDVPIARAVLASAALPGLFPPVEINGRYYVDGVLVKTLHASVALRAGAELLLCINPLVPFNADLAARHTHKKAVSLVKGGLPVVLAQTFRAIIHSRMQVGMDRYRKEFPKADVLLFQPGRDDADMFFTNVFSYSARRRLSEHAYQKTRAELRRRSQELEPILARHGIGLDRAVLADESRTLTRPMGTIRHGSALGRAALQLDRTLDDLGALLRVHST
ncbi:MAG: patatin-like phospholipase family protein [Hyphomicrobiales bacterium]